MQENHDFAESYIHTVEVTGNRLSKLPLKTVWPYKALMAWIELALN
jgi:hypothetical protein